MDKVDLWKSCCGMYQTSFSECRSAIHQVFLESLVTITELSEKEEQEGDTNFDRQDELQNIKTAYQYLLNHCSDKLKCVDQTTIVEKVIIKLQYM
jgi:DNA-binding ferritin-like protein